MSISYASRYNFNIYIIVIELNDECISIMLRLKIFMNIKENDIYVRIELEEFNKVGPIERVEYGTIIKNYTIVI